MSWYMNEQPYVENYQVIGRFYYAKLVLTHFAPLKFCIKSPLENIGHSSILQKIKNGDIFSQ